MKTVLVTGGAGYVGCGLVPKLLDAGYEVVVYDLMLFGSEGLPAHPHLRVVKGDIRDIPQLAKVVAGVHSVIHLACISNDPSFELDPALSRSINYDCFEPLVATCRSVGVRRFVYASTSSVYGVSDALEVTEDHPLVPLTDYNKYKGLCEPILLRYQSPEFTTVIIRPATICGYSPRMRFDLTVNILTNHAVNRRLITVFGGGQKRPNVHIDDLVDLYVQLLELPDRVIAGETFNVGYENHTVSELADMVRGVVEQEMPQLGPIRIETSFSNDLRSYHVSSKKIARKLGYVPKRSIKQAISEICEAFRAGKLPNSLQDDRYINVKTVKRVGAHMSRRRIAVVTGAAGFIGSHMVDLLLDHGYEVRAIDNLSSGRRENFAQHAGQSRLTVEVRDIRSVSPDDPFFRDARYVFHFAGLGDVVPSIEQPTEYLSTNVMGTVAALVAARRAGVEKFVYAASSSCYGLAAELPTTEQAPIDLRYPYALSKYLGEEALLHWGRVYRLPVVSIRIFNAYGPRVRTTGAYGAVFGVFLAQKLSGKSFTVVGDGTQRRDFVYVTDVAEAFLQAAESNRTNTIYNLGAGQPQSINRLVELLGGNVVYVPKRPGEPACTWADISKIRAELGWEPKVTFEEGVASMLRQIEQWRGAPVWDQASIQAATRSWFAALSGVNA